MRTTKLGTLLIALLLHCTPSWAGNDANGSMAICANAAAAGTTAQNQCSQPRSMKLQGRAEVQSAVPINPGFEAWRASQAYRAGSAAMAANQYKIAAQFFHAAGDGFETAVGEGKPVADARYAEAQACRLDKQDEEAARLFRVSIDLFKKYDPTNPYIKAGQGYLDKLSKSTKLKGNVEKTAPPKPKPKPIYAEQEGRIDSVESNVKLHGKAADATFKLAALKDGEALGGRCLSEAAAADVSDGYVKDAVYKGFLKMTCLEFAALGCNYYTAPNDYKAIKADGKTVIVGATDDAWNPVLRLTINGKDYGISMFLPGIAKSSKNVLVVTDNHHVLAIDPRKQDIWKLVPVFHKNGTADFSWWKLTHTKKGVPKKG